MSPYIFQFEVSNRPCVKAPGKACHILLLHLAQSINGFRYIMSNIHDIQAQSQTSSVSKGRTAACVRERFAKECSKFCGCERIETLTVRTNLIEPHRRQPGLGEPCASMSMEALNRCIRPTPARTAAATRSCLLADCLHSHFSTSLATSSGPAGIVIRLKSLSERDFL